MPEIDESGGMLPGTSVVHVDVSGLDAFAASIEAELEANFQPQAARLSTVYQKGSHFGVGHASSDVSDARAKHNECLAAAMQNLIELAKATQVLVDAARTVAANYRGADALAAANAQEAGQILLYTAKAGPAVQAHSITDSNTSSPASVKGGPQYG
jgi:hypothetical protein